MKMRLTRIVYDYTDDGVRASNVYEPCHDTDENAELIVEGDATHAKRVVNYTNAEWRDALYWIRKQGLAVDIVKAIDEVAR